MKLRCITLLILINFCAFTSSGQTAKAYFAAGVIKLSTGKNNEAASDFSNAIKLDKSYTDAYFNRAIAYERMGKDKKAIKDYGIVIEKNPYNATAYINRGLLFIKQAHIDKAIQDFSTAIQINSDNPFAFLHRARAYKALNRFEEAIEDYEKVQTLLPNLNAVHTDLIEIYRKQENHAKLVFHYSKLIETEKDNGVYFEERGRAYEKLGDKENACSDYRKAKALGVKTLDDIIMNLCNG